MNRLWLVRGTIYLQDVVILDHRLQWNAILSFSDVRFNQQEMICTWESWSVFFFFFNRYGTVDFNGTARRKNATRETTSTLKTWLYEHRKNPYPTKGEKIMLAIITKMTLTQVSTWFANARRRLKKENKMTWSPKNKAGEDRKDDLKSDQACAIKGKHLSTVYSRKLSFSITWKL